MGVELRLPRLSRQQLGGLTVATVAVAVTLTALLFVVGPNAVERTGLRRQLFPDRLDVWLDGELVIRRTPPAEMHTLVRTLRLDAGVHELRVE